MNHTIVHIVTVASSSVWFAMSVAALCIAVIMPFTKRRLPPAAAAARLQVEASMFVRADSPSLFAPGQATVAVPKDGNYHIAVDQNAGVLRQSVVRRSTQAAITVIPPVSGAITIVAHPDCPTYAVTATLDPPAAAVEEAQEEGTDPTFSHFDSQVPPAASPMTSETMVPTGEASKKMSLPQRMSSIFRRTSKRSSSVGDKPKSPSIRERSLSPIRKLLPTSEPEEPATAHGRIPYVPNPDDREMFESKFVNPFKRKSRKNSASPEQPSSPPTTASMGHQRRRSLFAYLNKAVHAQDEAPRSPSPRRYTTSVFTSRSSVTSSGASSRRSYSFSSSSSASSRSPTFSERSTHRTQPYGAPYYAAMPVPATRPRSHTRRASSGGRGVELSPPISEREEPAETPRSSRRSSLRHVVVADADAAEAARKRRHRSITYSDGLVR
ncbi:hypothetical protein PsYK624_056210 [Phanerochaete sordida]|uniref:Uncharacterized protein n=1 Tax=Phanerochaete sordida TaxID=48140 RepID=A0A9P3G811_9APHY|nr:hypothetical protein PsYK624_056210 [Phanerochaete sordida]